MALDLRFSSKWASGNASAQINTSSSTEKSVVVAYYQQVFYTITMDTPTTPAGVFDSAVDLQEAQRAFSERDPPAYVRSVDYGRLLMVKMETSSINTSVNLKGAFEQATQGRVTAGGKLERRIRTSSTTRRSPRSPLAAARKRQFKFSPAGPRPDLEGLKDYIAKDARYRRDNPGLPVAYTVAFLKDNEFARMGFTTDYTETQCVRYPNAFVKFTHAGAYVARFQVTWAEADAEGNYTQNKDWESGNQTAGYTHQVDLPGDAQGMRLRHGRRPAWFGTRGAKSSTSASMDRTTSVIE